MKISPYSTALGAEITGIKLSSSCGDNLIRDIKSALHDTLLFSDADSYPTSNQWIKKMQSSFSSNNQIVLAYSRLEKRKGLENTLLALKNFQSEYQNFKFAIIGDGEEKENLKDQINNLNLSNNIILFQNMDSKLKNSLIKSADFFIMPSIQVGKSVEGFGITYIEAASYGKPSIGGIYGGEGDAIKSGQTGYLCNGNDLNAIYDTLLKTLDNDHYLKLGANALEFSKDFSWEKIVKKYINLI